VMRALAKDPAARFRDADAFLKALDAAESAPDRPQAQRTAAFAAVSPEGVHEGEAPPPPPEDYEERERRSWARWAALALLVAGVAALVAYAMTRPTQVDVPNVIGQDVDVAVELLRDEGFEVETQTVARDAPIDQVLEQDPPPTELSNEQVDEGSTVTLSVSRGPGIVRIPDVQGLTERDATERLEKAGFLVDPEFRFSESVPEDRVIGTEPAAGTLVQGGSTVQLIVSRGTNRIEVPSVLGLQTQAALRALEAAELTGNVVQRDDDAPAGEVVGQSPTAGQRVRPGTQVTIFVSTGTISVPDVIGEPRKVAVTALKRAGFSVSVNEETTTDPGEDGVVLDQFPPAGSRGQRGDTVTISVGVFEEPPPPTP